MLIPDFICGHALDVKKACRKAARKIVKRQDIFVCEEKMLDTKNIKASYCFEFPDSTINHYQVIYIGYLLIEIEKNIRDLLLKQKQHKNAWENFRPYIEPALEKPWSFFMLLVNNNMIWIRNLKLDLPCLQSLIKFWDILNKEVTTFGVKGHGKLSLWQQLTGIKAFLKRRGVPMEEIKKPYLDGHISGLIEKYNLLDKKQ